MSDNEHTFDHAPELEPELQSAVWSVITEPVDPVAIERVKARARTLATSETEPITGVEQPAGPRRSQLGRILPLIAASVALMVVGGLWMSPTSDAFADALQQVREANTLQYVSLLHGRDADLSQRVVTVASDGRIRRESDHSVIISDPSGRPRLTLHPGLKIAYTMAADDNPVKPKSHVQWIQELREYTGDPEKRLGRKEIDGRMLEGFLVRPSIHAYEIWIDAETHQLARIEHRPHVEGVAYTKSVWKDFRFDVPVDESLFSYDVPEGYQARDVASLRPQIDVASDSGETNLLEALRGFTSRRDGRFPASITDWSEWGEGANVLKSESDRRLLTRVGAITPFLVTMSKDDYEYLGKGKSRNDDRSIVFWYRAQNGSLRAIFTDLTVAPIEESDLR